jgi:hypothetical protein
MGPKYNLLAELRPDVDATLEAGLEVSGIPDYMHDGLVMYLRYGVRPGAFLLALLSNDFMEACANADQNNQLALFRYAAFFYNLPNACYGSRAKVDQWLKVGAERRATTEGATAS